MENKRVVICGGHLTPTLPIIESLRKKKNINLYYIGRKKALEGDNAYSLEYLTINKINIPFYSLISGRLQRSWTRYTFISLLKFPIALVQSIIILSGIKPHAVVSFGSYVALPVCLSAKLLNIPVITHEQTQVMGFANRIISGFAHRICLAFPNTLNIPSKVKHEITGNPNLYELNLPVNNAITLFGNKNLPIIYITGGSLGSHAINNIIRSVADKLTLDYRIIHQTGLADDGKDIKILTKLKENLPQSQKENYQIYPFVDPYETQNIYRNVRLVIGRSGANTVSELKHYGVPSILIPLPWSADEEQQKNAEMLSKFGSAVIIKENKITADLLVETISEMMKSPHKYKNIKTKSNIKNSATQRMTEIIESFCTDPTEV